MLKLHIQMLWPAYIWGDISWIEILEDLRLGGGGVCLFSLYPVANCFETDRLASLGSLGVYESHPSAFFFFLRRTLFWSLLFDWGLWNTLDCWLLIPQT